MNQTETRSTRIAVFIDFDNVEIGVKSTIGGQFDIGLVLEAIKERGEIVTKVAYSDWKRVGDYSRLLTQHAIRMVQRNMTPGGDKNGADITMALDALEMCFTHDHINAFVIVGGDSDFISLVEKLKQYGRKVIVVGGRQFTSQTMQRNCHEFIAYENLVGHSRGGGRASERGGRPASTTSDMSKALPLVKRALKVLSDRGLTPQLGLLKSTLLQLDSTFSEREYGAGSFRDFMEKVAQTGAVTLKDAGRSMLVESRDDDGAQEMVDVAETPSRVAAPEAAPGTAVDGDVDGEEEDALPASPMSAQDGIRAVQHALSNSATAIRWPMYVRQAKQFLRSAIEGFDERKYGFASVVDLLRAAGKEGVLRIERDRQGAVRVFPGSTLTPRAAAPTSATEPEVDLDENVDVAVPAENIADVIDIDAESQASADVEAAEAEAPKQPAPEPKIVEGLILDPEVLEEPEDDQLTVLAEAEKKAASAAANRGRGRGGARGGSRGPGASGGAKGRASSGGASKAAKGSRPRARKSSR
jgi:uncharacterized protein (TIGR00288 family)